MRLGLIGLGRMGANMARRLLRGGHQCVVSNRGGHNVAELVKEGAEGASSPEQLVSLLAPPRTVWLMLPAGEATESAVETVGALLGPGDALIDGGNSRHQDDERRAARLAARGVRYLDVGTSGGVWGLERGYCLMVGGDAADFSRLEPVFETLAPGRGALPRTPGLPPGTAEKGYLHCGPVGRGHFAKMIHNGIEYGLMQSYAEGLDILRGRGLDVAALAELWRRGSVVQSWLLDLTAAALAEDPALSRYEGVVPDSGEGRWALEAAMEGEVPAAALAAALFARFRSRRQGGFADKALSAMRAKFGGHAERAPGA